MLMRLWIMLLDARRHDDWRKNLFWAGVQIAPPRQFELGDEGALVPAWTAGTPWPLASSTRPKKTSSATRRTLDRQI